MADIHQDWVSAAIDQGYSADDHSPEVLNEIGAAMERASSMWGWFEAGDDSDPQYFEAKSYFDGFPDDTPTEAAIVGAYAEGVVC